jgi:serine/threonine protein kinase
MQPDKLGRYEIIKELGRGAMGRVFLAHDPQIDRKVAIKTVQILASLPKGDQAGAREMLLREARSAGRLMHPGIVALFDVGEADEQVYLAMEYVEGTTLDYHCTPGDLLPVPVVMELIARVAEALHYAHREGIVHRDIKPANLIRVGATEVKITDFGLAKPAESQLTQDGALVGTPSYMSPEQIRGRQIDGRSDLFSLGVVLYELLTGERPFPGSSVSSIIYRIVNEEAQDPSNLHRPADGALKAFLERALAKLPEDRFSSGAEFASELRKVARRLAPAEPKKASTATPGKSGTVPSEASSGGPPPRATRPPRTSALPFVLGIILVLVAASAAAYHYRERLGLTDLLKPAEVWWEARVTSEPPGVEILLDGEPLDPNANGIVRFNSEGPFGVLSATLGCRKVERPLGAGDAGAEVILVLDPVELEWPFDPGVAGVDVRLNGERLGTAPLDLELDLCRENEFALEADGYRPAELSIPAEATPLEARRLLAALALEPIPRGRLILPPSKVELVYYLDGQRLAEPESGFELAEGEHVVRMKNESYWIDVTRKLRIVGGETLEPEFSPPPLTILEVQAYPPNCKVHLRRPGGKWKYLDDTPARKKIAVGRYEVRVTLNPTGESREQVVELVDGQNPPVRVSFGG